jgi:DNA-binding transcriptional LysR family regulator
MDLNQVGVFVRVVDKRGFTAAAQSLGLPKSSVSRAVSRLETVLGVRLLQRTTRSVHLTEAGAAFYARASRALTDLAEARETAGEQQDAPRGVVRVTAPVDLGVEFLAEIVARFARRFPEIRVEMNLTSRRVDLVEEGFDLALRAGRLSDSSLVARKLGTIESRLLASPAYLRRRGTPRSVAELAEHDCVIFRGREGVAEWALVGPEGAARAEVRGPIDADDISFLRRAVLAGAGIGLLPWVMCARDVHAGKLARVLPEHASRGAHLYLVYPSSRQVPRRVGVFRDFVVESMTPPPWEVCAQKERAALRRPRSSAAAPSAR